MHALEPYVKKSAPGHVELLRKFGPTEDEEDQHLRRLVVTLDLTLTDMSKAADYRANQARVFIDFNNDQIATMFSYARVISCDALPRMEKDGGFANNMRVWVREDDAENAAALISQQRWVAKVEPEATHVVHAANQELVRASGVTHRPTKEPARLSL